VEIIAYCYVGLLIFALGWCGADAHTRWQKRCRAKAHKVNPVEGHDSPDRAGV